MGILLDSIENYIQDFITSMQQYRNYKGAIWTNHALERLGQRGLDQEMAGKTFANPEKTLNGKQSGTKEYQRRFGNSLVTVIAKQNDQKQWLILSCWIDPPLAGTIDAKKRQEYFEYQRATFWGKFWITLKNMFR